MADANWIQETLKQHHHFRAIHLAQQLEWSEECYEAAKLQADACAEQGCCTGGNCSGPSGPHGQNLYGGHHPLRPKDAIRAWYQRKDHYDFARPGEGKNAAEFTQMVWVGTTHVGLAVSHNRRYIVANYWPAGNQSGLFEENVFHSMSGEDPAELIAGSEVETIGLHFDKLPPQQALVVKKVSPDSWAEAMGVVAGDLIMKVNDKPVSEMSADMLLEFMKDRPVTFKLPDAQQHQAITHIQALVRMKLAIRRLSKQKRVARLDQQGFKSRLDFINGIFELLDKNKDRTLQPVEMNRFVLFLEKGFTNEVFEQVYLEICRTYGFVSLEGLDKADLTRVVNDKDHPYYRTDDQLIQMLEQLQYEATLKPRPGRRGDVGLGMSEVVCHDIGGKTGMVVSMPPNPIVVRRVYPGSWADEKGLEPDDVILAINGKSTIGITYEECISGMKERPLRLRIPSEQDQVAAVKLQCMARRRIAKQTVADKVQARSDKQIRNELIERLFKILDQDDDGFLSGRDLLHFARGKQMLDFQGSDEEWFEKVYPDLCKLHFWEAERGTDLEDFCNVLNSYEDWHRPSDVLQALYEDELKHVSAQRLQKAFRGHRVRRELQGSREALHAERLERQESQNRQEQASVKIQSHWRGSVARSVATIQRKGLANRVQAVVKMQAAVRGKLVRKKTAEQFRRDERAQDIDRLFVDLDSNHDGWLSAPEMFQFIRHLGLLDSRDEWMNVYPIMAAEHGWEKSGVNMDNFAELVNNSEGDYYCSDDELASFLPALKKDKAALLIQKNYRGYRARVHVDEKRLHAAEATKKKRRTSAAGIIQKIHRGNAARKRFQDMRAEKQAAEASRSTLIQKTWDMLDTDRNGFLSEKEMYHFAFCLDLIDDDAEWKVVYPALCSQYGWESGASFESFQWLLNNPDDDINETASMYHCDDRQLQQLYESLKAHLSATTIQSVQRGISARREVAVRKASQESLRKQQLRRQEDVAAVRIQAVFRGHKVRSELPERRLAAKTAAEDVVAKDKAAHETSAEKGASEKAAAEPASKQAEGKAAKQIDEEEDDEETINAAPAGVADVNTAPEIADAAKQAQEKVAATALAKDADEVKVAAETGAKKANEHAAKNQAEEKGKLDATIVEDAEKEASAEAADGTEVEDAAAKKEPERRSQAEASAKDAHEPVADEVTAKKGADEKGADEKAAVEAESKKKPAGELAKKEANDKVGIEGAIADEEAAAKVATKTNAPHEAVKKNVEDKSAIEAPAAKNVEPTTSAATATDARKEAAPNKAAPDTAAKTDHDKEACTKAAEETQAVKAATTIQRVVRGNQLRLRVGKGPSFNSVAVVVGRRNRAWHRAFEEVARGSPPNLDEDGFHKALLQIHNQLSTAQVRAIWDGYVEGATDSGIGIRDFFRVCKAVAEGDEEAAEYADIHVDQFRKLAAQDDPAASSNRDKAQVDASASSNRDKAQVDASGPKRNEAYKISGDIEPEPAVARSAEDMIAEHQHREAAAIRIESAVRGKKARKLTEELREGPRSNAQNNSQAQADASGNPNQIEVTQKEGDLVPTSAISRTNRAVELQSEAQTETEHEVVGRSMEEIVMEHQHRTAAATLIQSAGRARKARRELVARRKVRKAMHAQMHSLRWRMKLALDEALATGILAKSLRQTAAALPSSPKPLDQRSRRAWKTREEVAELRKNAARGADSNADAVHLARQEAAARHQEIQHKLRETKVEHAPSKIPPERVLWRAALQESQSWFLSAEANQPMQSATPPLADAATTTRPRWRVGPRAEAANAREEASHTVVPRVQHGGLSSSASMTNPVGTGIRAATSEQSGFAPRRAESGGYSRIPSATGRQAPPTSSGRLGMELQSGGSEPSRVPSVPGRRAPPPSNGRLGTELQAAGSEPPVASARIAPRHRRLELLGFNNEPSVLPCAASNACTLHESIGLLAAATTMILPWHT